MGIRRINRTFVTNSGGNTVSVINNVTNRVIDTITVGDRPRSIAITPNGTRAYLSDSNGVSVINTITKTVITTITLPPSAGIAITPNGTRVYLTIPQNNSVVVINTATNTIIDTITEVSPLAMNPPNDIAITPNGTRAYVTLGGFTSLIVEIDTERNAVIDTFFAGGFSVQDFVITPDGTRAYVPVVSDGTGIIIIDLSTQRRIGVIVTNFIRAMTINPNGTLLYALEVSINESNVRVIDTETNSTVTTIPLISVGVNIAISPDGRRVFVAHHFDNLVTVINTSTFNVITTIPVGSRPFGIASTVF